MPLSRLVVKGLSRLAVTRLFVLVDRIVTHRAIWAGLPARASDRHPHGARCQRRLDRSVAEIERGPHGRARPIRLRYCLGSDTDTLMEFTTAKPIHFLGDSREALRNFPDDSRYSAGVELRAVQTGLDPADWKPMKTVGAGVREIRVREASGAFRVIYLATLPDRVLVLHAFQKKTQQTAQKDIDLATKRLKTWKAEQ